MKAITPMPRNALLWLMLSQLVVLMPHLERVPIWILLVYIGTAVWRLQMYRGRTDMPRKVVRVALVIVASTAVFFSYRSFIGLEPMIGLLLTATALKQLEAVATRDGYTLVMLGFFICITEFLFSQQLPIVVYTFVGTLLLMASLVTLNELPGQRFSFAPLVLGGKLLAQALPMMIVLFLIFPRIGPLWSVPSKDRASVTGMSDTLRPGQVSKLSRSSALAFRAQFDGDIPAQRSLYWRGVVMSQFDNGGWRSIDERDIPKAELNQAAPVLSGSPLDYQVIIEPTMQNWLFALPYAEQRKATITSTPDFRLQSTKIIDSQLGYQVRTWPQTQLELNLSAWRRSVELAIPAEDNPRTRLWIEALQQRFPEPKALVDAVLTHFRQAPFYYTLEPPELPDKDFVDRFMFDSRRGFCEHYAYSFVVMMRQAGIPARIVGGYQGGETNPLNNTVLVRQLDAHAWAEIWLMQEGWVRIDPTAAVSPARIEYGLEAALTGLERARLFSDSPLSVFRFRNNTLVNWIRLRYDAVAWRWQAFIVGFNNEAQISLLKQLFGEIRVSWFVSAMLGSWLLVLAPLAWWLLKRNKARLRSPAEISLSKLCRQLARLGIDRRPGEGVRSLGARVAEALPPAQAAPFCMALQNIELQLYQNDGYEHSNVT